MFVYTRFEALIRETGVTKASIARRLGRTPTICQDWKAGKSEPNDEQLSIVASALGTTPAYLRGTTDEKKLPPSPCPVRRIRSTRSSGSFFPMLTTI